MKWWKRKSQQQEEWNMPEHAGAEGAAHNASIKVEEDGTTVQPAKDVAMSEVGRKNEEAQPPQAEEDDVR